MSRDLPTKLLGISIVILSSIYGFSLLPSLDTQAFSYQVVMMSLIFSATAWFAYQVPNRGLRQVMGKSLDRQGKLILGSIAIIVGWGYTTMIVVIVQGFTGLGAGKMATIGLVGCFGLLLVLSWVELYLLSRPGVDAVLAGQGFLERVVEEMAKFVGTRWGGATAVFTLLIMVPIYFLQKDTGWFTAAILWAPALPVIYLGLLAGLKGSEDLLHLRMVRWNQPSDFMKLGLGDLNFSNPDGSRRLIPEVKLGGLVALLLGVQMFISTGVEVGQGTRLLLGGAITTGAIGFLVGQGLFNKGRGALKETFSIWDQQKLKADPAALFLPAFIAMALFTTMGLTILSLTPQRFPQLLEFTGLGGNLGKLRFLLIVGDLIMLLVMIFSFILPRTKTRNNLVQITMRHVRKGVWTQALCLMRFNTRIPVLRWFGVDGKFTKRILVDIGNLGEDRPALPVEVFGAFVDNIDFTSMSPNSSFQLIRTIEGPLPSEDLDRLERLLASVNYRVIGDSLDLFGLVGEWKQHSLSPDRVRHILDLEVFPQLVSLDPDILSELTDRKIIFLGQLSRGGVYCLRPQHLTSLIQLCLARVPGAEQVDEILFAHEGVDVIAAIGDFLDRWSGSLDRSLPFSEENLMTLLKAYSPGDDFLRKFFICALVRAQVENATHLTTPAVLDLLQNLGTHPDFFGFSSACYVALLQSQDVKIQSLLADANIRSTNIDEWAPPLVRYDLYVHFVEEGTVADIRQDLVTLAQALTSTDSTLRSGAAEGIRRVIERALARRPEAVEYVMRLIGDPLKSAILAEVDAEVGHKLAGAWTAVLDIDAVAEMLDEPLVTKLTDPDHSGNEMGVIAGMQVALLRADLITNVMFSNWIEDEALPPPYHCPSLQHHAASSTRLDLQCPLDIH